MPRYLMPLFERHSSRYAFHAPFLRAAASLFDFPQPADAGVIAAICRLMPPPPSAPPSVAAAFLIHFFFIDAAIRSCAAAPFAILLIFDAMIYAIFAAFFTLSLLPLPCYFRCTMPPSPPVSSPPFSLCHILIACRYSRLSLLMLRRHYLSSRQFRCDFADAPPPFLPPPWSRAEKTPPSPFRRAAIHL